MTIATTAAGVNIGLNSFLFTSYLAASASVPKSVSYDSVSFQDNGNLTGFPTGAANACAYGNNIYALQFGTSSSALLYYSSNPAGGYQSYALSAGFPLTFGSLNTFTYSGGIWIAGGTDSSNGANGRLYTSPDLETWTNRPYTSPGGTEKYVKCVKPLAGVGFGMLAGDTPTKFYTSVDGATWTIKTSTGLPDTVKVFTYNGSRLFAWNLTTAGAYSDDLGATWTPVTITGITQNLNGGDVNNYLTHANGNFILTGESTSGAAIQYSTDAISWNPIVLDGLAVRRANNTLYLNGVYYITAYPSSGNIYGRIYSSTNLTSWGELSGYSYRADTSANSVDTPNAIKCASARVQT